MAFKSLEQRFNENVTRLYTGAKSKFEGGRPSTNTYDDPLLVRTPGESQLGLKNEGRSLPFVSAPRDLKRLTLFQTSPKGLKFLLNQQRLQSGNTFEATRLINPLFILENTQPFLHMKRSLRPFGAIKTDTSYSNVRKLGQLQVGTYNDLIGAGSFGSILSGLPAIGPIVSTISAFTAKKNIGDKKGYGDPNNPKGWFTTRPELGTIAEGDPRYTVYRTRKIGYKGFQNNYATVFKFGGAVFTPSFPTPPSSDTSPTILDPGASSFIFGIQSGGRYYTYLSQTHEKTKWTHVNLGYTVNDSLSSQAKRVNLETRYNRELPNTSDLGVEYNVSFFPSQDRLDGGGKNEPFLKYFVGDPESISSPTQADQLPNKYTLNARDLAASSRNELGKVIKRISYIKDPFNDPVVSTQRNKDVNAGLAALGFPAAVVDKPYETLPIAYNSGDDPVVISFAMADKSHIQFRAFITDLQQSITPEYKNYQYIGRLERFINFTGVQRQVNFKLNVIAFSKDELKQVWTRINYLTGMAFPYGFTRGVLQPNIVRMTIGNVFTDQPMYINSLTTNFSEVAESWDIDSEAQVPISATMNMQVILIEKATKIATSPFYGITERMTDRFSDKIEIPPSKNEPVNPTTDPPVATEPEPIEQETLPAPAILKTSQVPLPLRQNDPRNSLNNPQNPINGFPTISTRPRTDLITNPFPLGNR